MKKTGKKVLIMYNKHEKRRVVFDSSFFKIHVDFSHIYPYVL
ncbi:hypothetical protein BMG_3085 [Priestia megaterium]|nr:hypothetical protein BMG_3085 [Priestia megaterium]